MKKTGDDYFDSEEFHELLAEYENALETGMPVFMDADELAEIADYYQMEDRYDEACAAIDLALSLSPGAVAPLTFKIHEALWIGNIDEARQYLSKIIDTDDPDYVYDKAEILLAEEHVEEADLYLNEELKKVPQEEHQDFVVDVANIFADYNYPEQAMMWMARAHQEDSSEFKELMARTLFGLGKYKESEKIWGELIERDPFSKHYWNAMASTQFMNENYSGSVESSEYAIAIDPDDPEGILAKANALYRLNNYEEAQKYFERYNEYMPSDEFGLMNQGACLVNLGRIADAIVKLEKAIAISPVDSPYLADIYQELSFAYSENGDHDKALQMLDKADEQPETDHVQIMLVRGHITLASGQLAKAERIFKQAVMNSDTPNETLLRVIVSIYDNRYAEAAYALFKKYFKIIDEGCVDGYAYMALCCYDLKRYDEFLSYLKAACELNPEECRTALSHLFPENLEPQEYYIYIKDCL